MTWCTHLVEISKKKVLTHYPEHLFLWWIVLRTVMWYIFWRFQPQWKTLWGSENMEENTLKFRLLKKNWRNFQYWPDCSISPKTPKLQDSFDFLQYLGYKTLILQQEMSVLEFACDVVMMPYNRRTSRPLISIVNYVKTMLLKERPNFMVIY